MILEIYPETSRERLEARLKNSSALFTRQNQKNQKVFETRVEFTSTPSLGTDKGVWKQQLIFTLCASAHTPV